MIEDTQSIKKILTRYKTIAVVGLSGNWNRPSHFAAKYMKEHGYRIIPVNPSYEEILGEVCYNSLLDIPEPVEIVDIFRRPEDVPPIVEDAISIGAKVVWMQLGVINHEAAERAQGAGLQVVMNRCVKIEYGRIFGGINFLGVNRRIISSKKS